jgi:hypothetical protein
MTPTGKIDWGWGYEIVWANNDKYCGKILVFEHAGKMTSVGFHKERRKSWFVNSGKFKIKYIDPATGIMNESVIEEGKTVDVAELSVHQLEALEANSIIFEVGTTDLDDRIRISPGDDFEKKQ